MRVLVLDDDAARRARAREALAGGGFHVEEAARWDEARARLDAGGIAVCVVAGGGLDDPAGAGAGGAGDRSPRASVRFVLLGSPPAARGGAGAGGASAADRLIGPWGAARLCAFVASAAERARIEEERRRRVASMRLLADDLEQQIERRERDLAGGARARVLARRSAWGLADDIAGPVDHVRLQLTRVLQPPVDLDEGCRDALEDAFGAAERVLRMAQDVRDVGLAEEGGLRPTRRDVEVRDLVTTAAATHGKLARDYHVTLEVELPEGPLGPIAIDAQLIHRAVLNLLERAIRQSRRGRVRIGARRDPDAVRIWVVDAGPTLAEEARARFFDRTARLDAAPGVQHRGMGVPFARAAALAHGGAICAAAEPGGGTRVEMTLVDAPAARARQVA